MAPILYVQISCTDPDWDRNTTEPTDIHLFSLLYIYNNKRAVFLVEVIIIQMQAWIFKTVK